MQEVQTFGGSVGAARVALVTGATAGMGLAIVTQLAENRLRVVVGARDVSRGEQVAADLRRLGTDALAVALDVTDTGSIAAAALSIGAHFGRLDAVVNNAGISLDHGKIPTEVSLQDFRDTYETNVFGVANVTNAMLPLLQRSSDARVINQSALLGSVSMNGKLEAPFVNMIWPSYNSSKAALNSLTIEYAKLLRDTSVRVYATSPGQVSTGLNKNASGGVSPARGALVAVRLATQEEPAPNGTFWGPSGQLDW